MPLIVHNNTNLSLTCCVLGRAPYDFHGPPSKTTVELRLELRSDSKSFLLNHSALAMLVTMTVSITLCQEPHVHSVLRSSEETWGMVTLPPLFRLGLRLRGQRPSQSPANKHESKHMNPRSYAYSKCCLLQWHTTNLKGSNPFWRPTHHKTIHSVTIFWAPFMSQALPLLCPPTLGFTNGKDKTSDLMEFLMEQM